MASDFLKKKAQEQATNITERFGEDAYGGTKWRNAQKDTEKSEGGNAPPSAGGNTTKASSFLTKKAQEQAASITERFGEDAYGGIKWRSENGTSSKDLQGNKSSQMSIGEGINDIHDQASYSAWRSTIRDMETVQADLDAMNAQIETLREEETQAAAAPKATKPWWQYVVEGLGGVQDTTLSLGAANQQTQGGTVSVSDAMQALLDKKALLQEEYDWSRYFSYADLQQAEDFAENSRYEPQERKEQRALDIMLDNYTNDASGWEDPLYEYVNGNQEAGDYIFNQARTSYGHNNPLGTILGTATNSKTESQQMKKEEIAIFNYLYKTRGPAAAHEYYDYLQSDLFARQREVDEAYWSQYAKEDEWGSSALSILTSPMKGLSYLGQAADYMADGTLDQNAGYNKFSYINSTIRESVAQKIEESGKWGKVGSFAYQTGMSMGDFLITTAVAGGNSTLSLAIMGSGAAADTTIAAKDRGLSDGQAFALGTIAGIAEAATERIQIDALLDKTGLGKTAMGYILKNALAEGGEEVASGLINTLADVIIAKDKSQWQQSIDAYMADGKTSEEEAFGKALADQAIAMGLDALGGILSGTAMAGGSAAFSDAGARITGAKLGKQNMDLTEIQALIDEGLGYEADSRAHYLAQQFQQKLATGKALSDYDIGRLYQANAQAAQIAQESDHETPARTVQEEIERQWRGGQVNQNTVTDVEETQESGARTTQVAAAEMDVAEIEQQAQRLSKMLGREVVLYSQEATENGIENGYYSDGKIYVNTRSGDPVAQIISHELTHSVEFADVYEELSGVVLRRIVGSGTNLAQLRQQTAALYAQNNAALRDNSEIDREIVADYVAKHLLTDEQSIVQLTQAQPSVGRRILEWLDRLLAKLGNSDARERAFLSRARNLYSQALGQTRGSFTGETADMTPAEQNADTAGEGITTDVPSNEGDLEELKAWMRKAYANGDMTDEEFESLLDLIMEREDLENSAEPAEVKHSISPVVGQKADYGIGVKLDTDLFDGVHPRYWGAVLGKYVYENLAGTDLIVYDEDGNEEVISFARTNDRVQKDGAKNRHRVIDELARYRGDNIKALATVHISELLRTSRYENTTDDNMHQWLDQNGWEHRKTYIEDRNGNIYEATLNIANGRDRRILYAISNIRKIDEKRDTRGAVPSTENGRGSLTKGISTGDTVAENAGVVNAENSQEPTFEEQYGLKLPSLDDGKGTGEQKFSISPSTVAKQDVISDLRGILQRGSDPEELRQYVDSLEHNTGNAERNNENAYHNNGFAEHNTGNAERNNENAHHNTALAEHDNDFAYQNAETTDQILGAAKRQGISVSQYLQENWEQYEVDGQWNAAARQALDQERGGRRRYSISAPEATKKSALDTTNAYQNVNLAEDSEVYNYEFLADLPDMNVVQLPEIAAILNDAKDVDKAAVVEQGIKNARSVGTERAGKVYVANRYTGRELRVDVKTIRHGLEGDRNRLLTNGRLASVIGDVIQNAVPVNALYDATNGLEGTYAMAGYATDSKGREFVAIITVEQHSGDVSQIDVFDVAHSVNGRQKRDARPDTKSQGVYPLTYTSKISISDLLSVVKDTFQSVLSDDVLSYFNEGRSPWGYYSDRTKFSISGTQGSNRNEVLADEAELLEEKGVDAENSRIALPKKAQDYLKRAERKLLNDIGRNLSVPWLARRDFLQEIVQEISNEYLRTGTVADEVIDRLFDTAYQQGVVVDAEFYNQYKDLKDHVRTLPLTISKQDQSDIADYADFKRRAFGTLRIVNEGGMPVDSAYEELRDMAPELFPDYVTHPADQLQRIYDVARSIKKVEKSLAEFYGEDAAEYKRWARNDFAEAINDVAGELWRVKRFTDEKAAADEANSKPPMAVEDAAEAYRKLKDARRAYEKVAAKNLLTEHDELIVGDLLRGKISLENLDPAEDNVKGITAVYEAKLEMEQISKQLADYKQHLRATMRKEADVYLETANEWTDKKVGIAYSRETMRRNVQDIVPDSELAAQINRKYFEPVAVAEAASTRFKEQYRQTVRDLGLSRKVEKGNVVSEAHAVQLLGEAMDNVTQINNARGRLKHRDGKTLSEWQDVIGNLWKENPHLDQNKIKNAVEAFRKIYDDLFQQMNRVRVANGYEPVNYRKGYFPHFQPGDGDGILAHFGRILGIDTSVVALPTTINGLTHTFKPGIQWFGNAQERLGFNTAYDAVEGFDKYIEGVASVIYQTQNIQNLRALASQIRYRTSDEGIRKQVDEVYENTQLTEEQKQVQIAGIYEHGKYTLSRFVVELDEYTNLLANKKSKLDRTVEALMGRWCYTILKWWEGRVGANMIAGNLSSALTNFIPLTQSAAQIGNRNLLAGMWNTLKAYKNSDGIVELSTFLTNRRGSDPLVKTWAEKASKVAGKPMEWIDTFVSDSIVRGAYYRNLKQGMSEAEALYQADIFAAGVMADRSKGAMPTLFSSTNPLFKAFTQFQLEVNNQFSEVFKDLPRGFKEKGLGVLAGVLFKYFLGAWLFNELYEYLFGRRPALDPIGILNETVGDLSGYELPNLLELGVGTVTGDMPSFETERVNFDQALNDLGSNLLAELPFSSGLTLIGVETDGGRIPASSAVPDLGAIPSALFAEGWHWKKRTKEAWDEISKPLTYVVMPFGGNQLQKIWKGLAAYFRGGSYTVDKDGNDILQYPVYNDTPEDAFWNAVRAAIMGKSSLPEAQEWVDSGFDSLSAKQTAAYQDMQAAGVADRDAYALLMELQNAVKTDAMSKTAVQREILRQSDVSGEGVAIAYYGLVASDADRELMDRLTDLGAEPGETVKLVMDLRETSGLKGLEKKQTQRDLIVAAKMTDEEKSAVMESILGSDLLDEKGNPTQYAKFLCTLETGLIVDEYLDMYGEGTDVDKYFEFTDAGVDPQEAKKLVISLEGLEPTAGAEEVAAVQKWRAAVDGVEDAADQLAALSAVMTDAQHAKAEIAYNFEVMPDVYVTMQELLPKYDADGNGSYKQAEITAAINAMGGSTQQKAVLWQLATGSTSAKNNPYSAAIGNQVIVARQKAKAKAEEDKPRTISEEIMRQLTGGK